MSEEVTRRAACYKSQHFIKPLSKFWKSVNSKWNFKIISMALNKVTKYSS